MPPSSSLNGRSTNSSSQPKQSTLFGFFGKPTAGPAPPSQRSTQQNTPGSKSIATKNASNNVKSPNVPTPPQSVQKNNGYPLQDSSSSNTMNRNVDAASSSPLRERSEGRSSNNGNHGSTKTSSMLEMTPPSSSPPVAAVPATDDDDEDEEMVTRVPRRRAAIKRQVNYAESDDEFGLGGGQDDDDDDKDQYKPENDRPAKKSRVVDSDDEFDDFVDLDEDKLEEIERNALKSKQKKQPATTQLARSSAKSSTSSHSVSSSAPVRRPIAGSSSAASLKSNQSKAQSPTEEPYEFLTNPKDKDGNPPNHPDYDKRTLHIPKAVYNTLTPFEKQFWDIKKFNNDTVLFFQKGKFYELYEDDAVIAHREFGLKMTDRVRMKMAGVPESSFTTFANKFLALGYKVGRVDQAETAVAMGMRKSGTMVGKGPATAGGNDSKIVRRELKHIYTNGTIVDADCLPDEMSSYCVSIKEVIFDPKQNGPAGDKDDESLSLVPIFGICFLDASTAEFKMRHFEDDVSRTKLETLLRSSRIKEVLHEKGGISRRTLRILKNTVAHDCNITMLKPHDEFLDAEQTLRKLNLVYNPIYQDDENATKKSLDTIEPADPSILPEAIQQVLDMPEALSALGAMLVYLTQLNLERDICASRKFDIFDPAIHQTCMLLDAQSLTHLNVLVNEQGDTQGTLLNLVNRAVTPFGKRLMRIWLLTPLAQIEEITSRQEAVEALLGDSSFREDFDIFAKSLPDIERIMPRVYAGNCKSADFNRVLKSFARFDENIALFKDRAGAFGTDVVQALLSSIPPVSEHAQDILSRCQPGDNFEPKPGHHDLYDQACDHLNEVERSLEAELVAAAKLLKQTRDRVKFKDIGTNEIRQVEVPIKVKVPDTWSLVSQTQSVKRYYPPEVRQLVKQLKEGRETKLVAFKEFQATLFQQFQQNGDLFLQAVKGIAEMDCLVSLAKASYAMGAPSCRPEFVESDTAIVDFEELRHPCMASTSTTEFIANDIALGGIQRLSDHDGRDGDEGPARVTILTGGNMAGKSTTARTTATAVVLAQLGCRVPASRARLSPIDRIASRMGANDQLFRNNSTFMVEMLEASRILKDCTPRSLVIMDELGRGTSTFDGQAIAYAVLHHLIGRTRCLCFFLTHYTSLAHEFQGRYGVANKHMQVLVDSEIREVIFTYKLVDGIAESSYGTEVAALAGVPMEICDRATKISREFAATTKEAEKERMQKMGDALSVATLSDFALIFKAGSGRDSVQDSQKKKESFDMDEQALNFMRKQIATVMASRSNGVENEISIRDRKQGFGRSLAGRKRGYRQRSKESESEKDERTVMPSFFSDEEGDETPPTSSQSESVKDRYSLSPFKSKSFPRKKSKSSTPKLQQMTLDLGQKMRIECQKCGMSYDRTDTKDVQMHTRHHTAMMQGMEWCLRNPKQKGRLIGQHTLPKSSIDVYLAEQDIGSRKSCKEDNEVQLWAFAVESGQQDPSTMAVLQDVQNIMDSALGSVPIELHSSVQRMDDKRRCQKKLIVAIWRDRVVGSALVGELPKSADVYRISSEMEKAVIINANDKAGLDNVPLAVHRIYVISILRRSGIASAILDAALDDCVYGMHKQEVIRTIGQGTKANTAAFSQPTESGRLLAQRWIQEEGGKNNGVLVFEEA